MKKDFLMICAVLTAFSLTTCGQKQNDTPTSDIKTASAQTAAFEYTFLNAVDEQLNPEFYYGIESRYNTTIAKEKLHNALSIIDILPEKATELMETYENVTIGILHDDTEINEIGKNEILNAAQLKLLQATDYSANFYIKADCKTKNKFGELENYYLVYYITVVPEVAAEFALGKDALIDYLKTNSKAQMTVITKDKLKSGQVNFTITKEGKVDAVKLESTSGYPAIDKTLTDLIINMPKVWIPATNSKGEKVAQDFIFFFGGSSC